MTVLIAPGSLFVGGGLVEQSEQSTVIISAPSSNPRIDLVYIDTDTGAVGVETGVEAPSPAAPDTPTGSFPVAHITLQPTSTAITDAMIEDVRAAIHVPISSHNALASRDASDAHPIAAITGLQAALNGKSATGHTHTVAQITNAGTAATRDAGTAPGNVPVLDAEGKLVAGVLPTSGVPSGLIMLSSDGTVPAGWEKVENPLDVEITGRVSPIMTGPTTGDWTATESPTPSEGAFWKVFDGSPDQPNYWITVQPSDVYGVLENTASSFTFDRYKVTSTDRPTYHPKDWRMQYWAGADWQTAHTVTNEPDWGSKETRLYMLPQKVTTQKIRFYMDSSNDLYLGIAELELIQMPIWVRKI
jgi:hypothetical protein